MLEELRRMLQDIEDARALIVCHPEDAAAVRLAVDALSVVAPRVQVDQWVKPGEALVFPDPSALRMVIP